MNVTYSVRSHFYNSPTSQFKNVKIRVQYAIFIIFVLQKPRNWQHPLFPRNIQQLKYFLFSEVLLDKAVMISSAQRARTIEKCECPKEYTSLSCQDPSSGYYRHRLPSHDSSHTWVDRIVGVAKKCNCNGLSNTCDVNTGHCLVCKNGKTLNTVMYVSFLHFSELQKLHKWSPL